MTPRKRTVREGRALVWVRDTRRGRYGRRGKMLESEARAHVVPGESRKTTVMNPDQHKRTQFSIVYVVAGLLLILGLQWFVGGGASTDVAYSDFKTALSAQQGTGPHRVPDGHPGDDDHAVRPGHGVPHQRAWMSRTS